MMYLVNSSNYDMFELNKTEVNILETFLIKDPHSKGLSTYAMNRDKKHIPYANWSKYKHKLLYFQLISEKFTPTPRPHKFRKSESRKSQIRYHITPIGILSLLQNLNSDQISSHFIDDADHFSFLPLISKYDTDLDDLEKVFHELLKYSIKHIELKPLYHDTIEKDSKFKNILERSMQEKITLSFPTQETEMSFFRTIYTLSKEQRQIMSYLAKQKKSKKDIESLSQLFKEFDVPFTFDNYDSSVIDELILSKNHDVMINDISTHLTFLFYFYLMLCKEDDLMLYEICLNTITLSKSPSVTDDFPELVDFTKQALKLQKESLPKIKLLIEKIKNDPEIIQLFTSNLEEIQAKYLSVDFLEYIDKIMTR